jgi:WD40 repeat protein
VMSERRGRRRGTGRLWGYDAFISYSHALDGKLAPVLQREIERFATPWYQARALRVFRDNASLTANPDLWSSIEQALATSQWFVLMASPDAAGSPWVDREVSWWLANRSVRRLLIVLTEGELAWNQLIGDFDRPPPSVLPPSLRGTFTEQPRWVDLRWLRETEQVDRSNPKLRDCIADVAAAVRGIDKDLLVGEHIRQRRRALRLAWGGVTTLALLLVVAVVAAIIAVGQRNTAVTNARVATARQLAALAVANLNTHLDLAQLFAVAAYRTNPDSQTRSALAQAVTSSPHLMRFLPAAAQITAVTGSSDGNHVVVGTANGHILRWDLARNTHDTLQVSNEPISSVTTDVHGTKILATDKSTAVLWNTTSGKKATIRFGQAGLLVAISPSGRRLAVLDEGSKELAVLDGDSGQQLSSISLGSPGQDDSPFGLPMTRAPAAEIAPNCKLGLPDDTTVMLINPNGTWERRSIPTFAIMASSTNNLAPANSLEGGYSAEGDYYGYIYTGQGSAWHLTTSPGNSDDRKPDLKTTFMNTEQATEAFAISADGTRMATKAAATVYVASVGPDQQATNQQGIDQQGIAPMQLTGAEGVTALEFVGNQRLVAVSGDKLVLWDLASPGRLGTDLGVTLGLGCHACRSDMALSPDGQRLVFVTSNQATEYQLDGPINPQVLAGPTGPVDYLSLTNDTLPVWSPNGNRLILLGMANNSALVWDPNNPARAIAGWPSTGSQTVSVTARVSADGARIAVIGSHGDVVVRKFTDGTTERTIPGDANLIVNAASINYNLTTAALADEREVSLLNLHNGSRHVLPGGSSKGVLFTRNELLVLRPNGTLEVWDTTGTRLLRSIPGTPDYYPVLAAPPQGEVAAILRSDNVVMLTDLNLGVTLGSFPLPPAWWIKAQTVMAFTPNGTQLIIGASGGRLTRWNMTDTAWIHTACATAGRNLTATEWTQIVGTPPPGNLSCLG